ncbi:MAG TPA: SGNH/GDSL hydrolase family protein [Candidatus Mediterraneibacter merdavium]|nr:SGNH/GDSL hydrolase family protein [Candidatus Mediterraneibacter merdavium]
MRKYRYIQSAAILLLAVCLALTAAPVYISGTGKGTASGTGEETQKSFSRETSADDVQGQKKEDPENGEDGQTADTPLYVAVLGDSIAKGYCADKSVEIVPYAELAAERIAGQEDRLYEVGNFAKNGLDSVRLNAEILEQEEVREGIGRADIIFITVGSNDLLNECKNTVREILDIDTKFKSAEQALKVLEDAMAENPLLIVNIIAALGGWDYQSFLEEWKQMMTTVNGLRKEEAIVIVTNIYNPVENMELPSTMNGTAEDIIENMNVIIEGYAGEYDYAVADVFSSGILEHVQADGLHPDQEGQELIADLVCGIYEAQ